MPRLKDFRGLLLKGFDERGFYTLGLREQLIFPEIIYDNIDKIRGLSISFVTTAQDTKKAFLLLKKIGMPFKDETTEKMNFQVDAVSDQAKKRLFKLRALWTHSEKRKK